MKKILLLSFTLSFFFQTCFSATRKKSENNDQSMTSIQQDPKDLLSGVSNALSYSGFRTGQHPDRGAGAINPTDEQVLEDLHLITQKAGVNLIRLYDSGENSEAVLRIITQNKINIKVMLGIWLNAELSNHQGCSWLTEPIPQKILDQNKLVNSQEIKNGIRLANQYPEIVVAVNVGNESLVEWNDHKVDVDTIISYVRSVKKAIKQPVSVADNYEWWAAKGQKLAKELDFVSIHVYPIWEGKDINEGMSYTIENVQKVRNALPDSKIVISEAGWASVASEFGNKATEEKQQQYYKLMKEWSAKMNYTTFFFEAFDEDWKGNPADSLGAEKHWGLFTVDRKPKIVLQ